MEHDKEHMCRRLKVDVPKIGQFLTGRVLKPLVGARVLDSVISSRKKRNIGRSDHDQLHFDIKIKSDKLSRVGEI